MAICSQCGSIFPDSAMDSHTCDLNMLPKENEEIKRDGSRVTISE